MILVERIEQIVRAQFAEDASGHDWFHIERVWNMAKYLHSQEGGDLEVIELAALLHDISDHKLNGGKLNDGGNVARQLLLEEGAPEALASRVASIIDRVSFKGANVKDEMESLEGKIVQDSDRLDAIGAIGIARTFAYGGHNAQPMYDPRIQATMHDSFEAYASSKTSTIHHFYEKLLLLTSRINTEAAKKIAQERHQFKERYLSQFFHEWNFNTTNA